MLEDSSRSDEVVESSWFAGGNGRGANVVEYPVWGHPVDHCRLNELVPINDHYVLSLIFAGQILRQQFRVGLS